MKRVNWRWISWTFSEGSKFMGTPIVAEVGPSKSTIPIRLGLGLQKPGGVVILALSGVDGIMARLILIRHGQSVANAERRFTTGPEEPLSALGRDQAAEMGEIILAEFQPVALYSSPFERALETARVLGSFVGLKPSVVDELQEQDLGDLLGKSYDAAADLPRHHKGDRWTLRPPGGETLREVADRVGPAIEGIAQRHEGEEVIVVSHAGVMASFRGYAAGGFGEFPRLTHNACGFVVEHDSEGFGALHPLEIEQAGSPQSGLGSNPRG